jgi:hypothetical protein
MSDPDLTTPGPAGDVPLTPTGSWRSIGSPTASTIGQGVPEYASASAGRGPLPRLPGYDLLEELGRGGMGVVYKARQIGLDRPVAVKMILAGRHAGPDALARFHEEAKVVASLRHPNVVQMYDAGVHEGLPFFALEFVGGGSLDGKLSGQPLPLREAAELTKTLASAIEVVHRCGIVHRDLKPANILLDADGTPKIADFGLAKMVSDDRGRTATGAVLGTPSYMAPEQAGGRKREIGPAADVYALGAMLYQMLTGRPPFVGETALDTLLLLATEDAVPPRTICPAVPRALEAVCLKCLRKDPASRYASAGDLAADLDRFLGGLPVKARSAGPIERMARWAGAHPGASLLNALTVLLMLIAAAMTVGAPDSPGGLVLLAPPTIAFAFLLPGRRGLMLAAGLVVTVGTAIVFGLVDYPDRMVPLLLAIVGPAIAAAAGRTLSWAYSAPPSAPVLGAVWSGLVGFGLSFYGLVVATGVRGRGERGVYLVMLGAGVFGLTVAILTGWWAAVVTSRRAGPR